MFYFVWYFVDKNRATYSRSCCTSGLEIGTCCDIYLLKSPLGSCVSENLAKLFKLIYIFLYLFYGYRKLCFASHIDKHVHLSQYSQYVYFLLFFFFFLYLVAMYIDSKNKNCACRRASASRIFWFISLKNWNFLYVKTTRYFNILKIKKRKIKKCKTPKYETKRLNIFNIFVARVRIHVWIIQLVN